eukprot:jgi/Bigna1/144316/aug1.86_g19024
MDFLFDQRKMDKDNKPETSRFPEGLGADNKDDLAAVMSLTRLKRTIFQWARDRQRNEAELVRMKDVNSRMRKEMEHIKQLRSDDKKRFQNTISSSEEEIRNLRDRLEVAHSQITQLKTQRQLKVDNLESMLQNHRKETASLKIKLYELSEQRDNVKKKVEDLAARSQIDLDMNISLQKRYNEAAGVIYKNTQSLEEMNGTIENIKQANKQLQSKLQLCEENKTLLESIQKSHQQDAKELISQINHLQTELWKEKQKSNEIQAKLREEILLRKSAKVLANLELSEPSLHKNKR